MQRFHCTGTTRVGGAVKFSHSYGYLVEFCTGFVLYIVLGVLYTPERKIGGGQCADLHIGLKSISG